MMQDIRLTYRDEGVLVAWSPYLRTWTTLYFKEQWRADFGRCAGQTEAGCLWLRMGAFQAACRFLDQPLFHRLVLLYDLRIEARARMRTGVHHYTEM